MIFTKGIPIDVLNGGSVLIEYTEGLNDSISFPRQCSYHDGNESQIVYNAVGTYTQNQIDNNTIQFTDFSTYQGSQTHVLFDLMKIGYPDYIPMFTDLSKVTLKYKLKTTE